MDHEKTLADWITQMAADQNYDCPQAMLAACSKYYGLSLDERAIAMMAGFGEGMFIQKGCGALYGATAALSLLMDEAAKRDASLDLDLETAMKTLVAEFQKRNGMESLDCKKIKEKNWQKEGRFVQTDLIAGQALESTLQQLQIPVFSKS